MGQFAGGITFKVGDGASTEVFTGLAVKVIPEIAVAEAILHPNRTTESTGSTKTYRVSDVKDGESYALGCEVDLANAQQDALRAAFSAGTEVNCQWVITDGSVTVTRQAAYLVTSIPETFTDPNGDGEVNMQTFNIKRNGDETVTEV